MYREQNGHVDTGNRCGSQRCWNCGSTSQYRQTVSLEECTACGIRCDYWGGGTNDAYNRAMNAKDANERARQEAAEQEEYDNW